MLLKWEFFLGGGERDADVDKLKHVFTIFGGHDIELGHGGSILQNQGTYFSNCRNMSYLAA